MAKELVPIELWEEIRPLLPPRPAPSPKGGRPPVDDLASLRGIAFVLKTGIPWQDLPTEAFHVSGSSCWRRHDQWTALGIWPAVHARLLNRLGRLGGVDLQHAVVDSASVRAVKGGHTGPNPTDRGKKGCKRHVLTDADGVPLAVGTTPANVPDQDMVGPLLDAMPPVQGPRGRPKAKPAELVGDRAYGVKANAVLLSILGVLNLLAPRGDGTHGGGLGAVRYVVERTLACFGQHRRLKVCYERTAEHWQGFHDLAACLLTCTRLRDYRKPWF